MLKISYQNAKAINRRFKEPEAKELTTLHLNLNKTFQKKARSI